MSISVVAARGSKTSLSTGTSFTVTVSGNTTLGNHAIMAIATRSATVAVSSITDSKGNRWQVDTAVDHVNLNRRLTIASAYLSTALLTSDTITIQTAASTGDIQVALLKEVSGLDTADWYDKTASLTQDSGANIVVTAPAGSVADEIVVAAFLAGSTTSTTWGAGTTSTTAFPTPSIATSGSTSGNVSMHMRYSILSSIGARSMDADPPTGTASVILTASYMAAYPGAHLTVNQIGVINTVNDAGTTTGHVAPIMAAIPTTGTWLQGDVVWNSGAAAGGKAGWICIVAGTPGTWKPFGVIDP